MKLLYKKALENKEIFLRLFILLSLFFPAFYSVFDIEYKLIYYAGFSWPYLMAGIYLLLLLAEKRGKGKMSAPLWGYFLLLLIYNLLSLYFNIRYLHWYWEQINNTLGFLLLGMMICCGFGGKKQGEKLLRFLILCIMGSTLCGILFYFTGEIGIYFCNHQIYFAVFPDAYESRTYWLYSHKSDYALMIILFTALIFRWRHLFTGKQRWIPWAGIGMMAAAMLQTHSFTGMAGLLLVIAGMLLDKVNWKKVKPWHLLCLLLLAAAGLLILGRILEERDLGSLGGRLDIWRGALETIREYPQGWGLRFGDSMFYAGDSGWMVNNAHNVFLNAVLRFSIPVGICFTFLFIWIVVYSVGKAKSFLAAGMWTGILMLMNMDYALVNYEIAMMLFLVYLVCIYGKADEKRDYRL